LWEFNQVEGGRGVRKNKVKHILAQGGVAIGTNVFEFGTTGIARIAMEAGADFIMFDMEHTGWGIETIRMLMATSCAIDLVPLVRPPAVQYHLLSRPLDVGAMGLMLPMVETEEQARLIVHSAKYFPQGGRGAAFGFSHDDYQEGDIAAKMKSANEEQLLIALIETAKGVENADKIAAVDGIDVLSIGHCDLTSSLGIPGQFTHPKFLDAVRQVLKTAQRHGKAAGYTASSVEEGRSLLAQGFRCLAYSGDISIYRGALNQAITALRDTSGCHP